MANCTIHPEVEFPNHVADRGIAVADCPQKRSFGRCGLGGFCHQNSSNFVVINDQHGGDDFHTTAMRHGIQSAE